MSLVRQKIGFIGCGNMGQAILAQLFRHRLVSSRQVYVAEPAAEKRRRLKRMYPIELAMSNAALCRKVSIVILAMKPQQLADVASEIAPVLSRRHIVISVLAGTPVKKLRKRLGKKVRIVRTMPNLGVTIGAGLTAIATDSRVKKADLAIVRTIFQACGEVVGLPERFLDLVTALSGNGPAYYFFLTEHLIREGVRYGLTEPVARRLAVQTAIGAAMVMQKEALSPAVLRKRVTSKGGATEAAIKILKKGGCTQLFHRAIAGALKRAYQLSRLT